MLPVLLHQQPEPEQEPQPRVVADQQRTGSVTLFFKQLVNLGKNGIICMIPSILPGSPQSSLNPPHPKKLLRTPEQESKTNLALCSYFNLPRKTFYLFRKYHAYPGPINLVPLLEGKI